MIYIFLNALKYQDDRSVRLDVNNYFGETPIDVAWRLKHQNIVTLIQNYLNPNYTYYLI